MQAVAIADHAASVAESAVGVAMITLVSQQLCLGGQQKVAGILLDESLKRFDGPAERRELVNQLVEQGHRPAPSSELSEKQLSNWVRQGFTPPVRDKKRVSFAAGPANQLNPQDPYNTGAFRKAVAAHRKKMDQFNRKIDSDRKKGRYAPQAPRMPVVPTLGH